MSHARLYSPAAEHHRSFWPVLISCPAEGRRLSWLGWLNGEYSIEQEKSLGTPLPVDII